jgi:hypothetical protein
MPIVVLYISLKRAKCNRDARQSIFLSRARLDRREMQSFSVALSAVWKVQAALRSFLFALVLLDGCQDLYDGGVQPG